MRLLGIGKRSENAVAMQSLLREAGHDAHNFAITDDAEGDALLVEQLRQGYDARNFAITDDAAGDALLVQELQPGCDAVLIGSFINGQHAELPASPQTTAWFNRILNLIAEHAPGTRVVLVRKPSDVAETVARVLGRT